MVPTRASGRARARRRPSRRRDNVLVAELRQAYRILDSARPIYHGHRGKARQEINAAIGQLEKEMHKRGLKAHPLKGGIKEPKSLSNAMVKETARELGIIVQQISAMPSTKFRAKAVQHLGTAIKELELALLSVKPKLKATIK